MEKRLPTSLMQWHIIISISKNPLLWFQLLMVISVSSFLILLLFLGFNLFENDWNSIPDSFVIALSVAAGMFILFSLVLLVMFWRGVPTKYVLQDERIEQHTLSKSVKITNRLGPLAILSGSSAGITTAGSSLLARTRDLIAVEWIEVSGVDEFPARKEIRLKNNWRTIMQVFCPDEQFVNISQFIKSKTEKNAHSKISNSPAETPFAYKLMLSFISLVFGFFLLPRLPVHYIGIFTLATVIFALLAIWSGGLKQRLFGGVLFLLPITGVVLAYLMKEIEMYEAGAIYALLVEIFLLGYFTVLGLLVAFRIIK